MREARYCKGRMTQGVPLGNYAWRYNEQEWYDRMVAAVRRARQAHRDWRQYRALDAADVAMDARIEHAFAPGAPPEEREQLLAELRARPARA
jgi:hypothetical protein